MFSFECMPTLESAAATSASLDESIQVLNRYLSKGYFLYGETLSCRKGCELIRFQVSTRDSVAAPRQELGICWASSVP